jgi:hypothetical protein
LKIKKKKIIDIQFLPLMANRNNKLKYLLKITAFGPISNLIYLASRIYTA